ncbi:30S ribosomal protein S9 [Candidatus Micrarchaeota archaeon]|nr:30S ribosomal protein S9 [Candidatus Micrarchaeota archaeon]
MSDDKKVKKVEKEEKEKKKSDTKNDVKKEPVKKDDKAEETKVKVKVSTGEEKKTKKGSKSKSVKPKKRSRKTKAKKPKKKVVLVRGKRKKAIARAVVKEGNGNFRVNHVNITAVHNSYLKEIMYEPLAMLPDILPKIDISVTVRGGGPVGQAQAVRSAVARAIYAFTGDEKIKDLFIQRDRFMFVEDSRRVEPKKYMGPKARARKQKSYR